MTFCAKSKMTSKQDGFAKCREIENASAFLGISSSIDYRLTSNVSREKSFNSGYAIHSIHRCSSNRLSVTFGQSESEIITVLWRVVTANWSFGFGSAHTKNITISLSNCDSRLATQQDSPILRSPPESLST